MSDETVNDTPQVDLTQIDDPILKKMALFVFKQLQDGEYKYVPSMDPQVFDRVEIKLGKRKVTIAYGRDYKVYSETHGREESFSTWGHAAQRAVDMLRL